MKQSSSPGGLNALKETIQSARAAYKSTHLANSDAGSKLAASIAQAAMTLQKELKKTPDKSPNLTVKPLYLELEASIETAQKGTTLNRQNPQERYKCYAAELLYKSSGANYLQRIDVELSVKVQGQGRFV